MAIDLRHSADRVDNLQSHLETYADAVMGVLDASSGDWGGGMYYGGGYQVAFGPVSRAVRTSFRRLRSHLRSE